MESVLNLKWFFEWINKKSDKNYEVFKFGLGD